MNFTPPKLAVIVLTAYLCILTGGLVKTTQAQTPVNWINLANTTATGNNLQKTSGQYDAGGISQQQITATGGYFEFKVSTGHNIKVGFSNDLTASTDYTQLKYYFNFWGSGDFDIREGWANSYNPGTHTANDVFRISVEGGVVKYYKNGVPLRTSTVSPSYPLVLDTSITTLNGTIQNAVISNGGSGNDQVVISDPNISFIIGPQLVTGAGTNPWAKFDTIALQKGDLFGQAFPKFPPLPQLTGTVSATNGTKNVVGNGTKFLSEIDPNGAAPYYNGRLRINAGGALRVVQVASVQDDTHLTLVSNWAFATGSGFGADTYYYDPVQAAWNYDNYLGDAEFYDLALSEYILYYRTGQTKYRDYARKIADSRWMSEWINYGTLVSGPKDLAPRNMGYAGLMLRALDGRPEFWDYLNRQVQSKFDNLVWIRRNDPKIWQDLREGGYANLYAVMLAKVLPDSYPLYGNGTRAASTGQASNGAATRAAYLSQVEKLARISGADSYFGRLQLSNGAWKWDLDNGSLVNLEQPFMVGIYLEGAILLHQLSSDSSVKADIVTQLTKSVTHLYNDGYRTETVADMPQYQWRGTWYFTRGGPPADPNRCNSAPGVTGCSGDVEKGKPNTTGGFINIISGERNLQGMISHSFGYLYKVTGNAQYKSWGDELFDSSFGNDGVPSFPDIDTKQKTFSQNYRSQSRYLVWRLGQ
jgi:hypothetical protein